jgi:Ala-tRNA(Pro) deacylase
MNRREKVLTTLQALAIPYALYEHPAAPTVAIARKYWDALPEKAQHCKNLFFRNHKGNQHYLVILDCDKNLSIHELEHRLQQGKLTFASEVRMMRYLGVSPGSVSIFGLINDTEHHVHVFLDNDLLRAGKLSFHPNENTASVIVAWADVVRFLQHCGNRYEFIAVEGGIGKL